MVIFLIEIIFNIVIVVVFLLVIGGVVMGMGYENY